MWRGKMELANEQRSLLDEYLDDFQPLVGDQRTERVLRTYFAPYPG